MVSADGIIAVQGELAWAPAETHPIVVVNGRQVKVPPVILGNLTAVTADRVGYILVLGDTAARVALSNDLEARHRFSPRATAHGNGLCWCGAGRVSPRHYR